jgi:hypothetical protein
MRDALEALARRYFDGSTLTEYLRTVVPATVVELRMRPEPWSVVDQGG